MLPALQPLGSIAVLPNELLCHILADVDIPTLTAFRRVNRIARAKVDNVPEYNRLVQFHPDVLRAVVASQAGAYSCRELSAELRGDTKCRGCSGEATHLYLITCRLLCRSCFTSDWRTVVPPRYLTAPTRAMYGSAYPYPFRGDPEEWNPRGSPIRHPFQNYAPLQEAHVVEHCKAITQEELSKIPHIVSLPAQYRSENESVSTGPPVRLYDTQALLASHKLTDCYCMRSYPEVMRRYQSVIALHETETESTGDVPFGVVRDPFEPSYREVHML